MNLPGSRLLSLATRHLDAKLVESIVVPTIADLQHETLDAGANAPRRWLALAHGYAAIVRLLLWHGLLWRFPMRRLVSVLVLGGAGAVFVVLANLGGDSRQGLGAVFLIAMAASVTLRFLRVGRSYRQVFVSCMSVGMIVATTLFGWIVLLESLSPDPWYSYALFYLFLTGWVSLGSVLAAAVAWRPAPERDPIIRRWLTDVATASATFAAGFLVRGFFFGPNPRHVSYLPSLASWAAYVAFIFAAIALVVYLPVMAGARRAVPLLGTRLPLATIGALLFPVPLFAIPLLGSAPGFIWHFYLQNPRILLPTSIPYILAGAVLGWLVAERPRESARATS